MEKNKAKLESDMTLEEKKNGMKVQFMNAEAEMKMKLMDHEFEINMKLRSLDNEAAKSKEHQKDDRKDDRTKIQASQQSHLVAQKKDEKSPKNFESAGNDTLGSGMGVAGLSSN